jgi:hypothetical protein
MIRDYLLTGYLPDEFSEHHPLWVKQIEFFEIKNGILYRREPSTRNRRRNHSNFQVVLLLSLRPVVMKEMHDELTAGHLAFQRTYLKVKNHYYWPEMLKDIKEYCTNCEICIANTKSIAPVCKLSTHTR